MAHTIAGGPTRRLGGALLVVAAAAALGGCSSSSGAGPQTTAPAVRPSTQTRVVTTSVSSVAPSTAPAPAPSTSSGSSSAPAPSSSSGSSSAPRGTSDCSNAQLTVRSTTLPGATSHSGLLIVFTNRSKQTCSLVGYPGAADLDAKGTQIVQAQRTLQGFLGSCGCKQPERVTLKPGATASSVVEGSNGGGDECLRGRALLVTPPNTKQSTKFTFEDYSCEFQIHPVVTGSKARLPS